MSYTISMNHGPRMSHRVQDICIFVALLETELPVNGSMLVQNIEKIGRLVFEILTERGTDGRTDGRTDRHVFCSTFHTEQKYPRNYGSQINRFCVKALHQKL